MTQPYDVIIVGARVAGAATAALLAEQGAQVLLLDKAIFPAPTVSCPVFFGNSLSIFERIGVIDAVERIGAPRIKRYGSRGPGMDLVARLPAVHGRDYAYAIRRDVLDTTVLNEIRKRSGITVRENFSVTGLIWGGDQVVGVRGRQGGGSEQSIYARAVVGADGKRSIVARLAGADTYATIPGDTCIFYAYYRNFHQIEEPSALVYADETRSSGALIFDADDGLTVVSVGVPAEQFDAARKDAEGTLERTWRSIPEVAERGRDAVRATAVMGQGPTDSFYRKPFGPGWALVGDAGHYLDPITGQGINNALRSAELFAAAWARTQGRWSWQRALEEFWQQRDRETRPMYDFTANAAKMRPFFENPVGRSVATMINDALNRQPEEATRYIGIYCGATDVGSFFNPMNLLRIVANDAVRQALDRRLRSVGYDTTFARSLTF